MDKLLPCPMCGKPAATDDAGVHCSDVGCGLHLVRDCTAEQWNTRHTPEGWRTVPESPTHAMHLAGESAYEGGMSEYPDPSSIYREMLAAAPKWGE